MTVLGSVNLGATKFYGLVVIMFGLLQFATSANELLKQSVITPGSFAESATGADCREDELLEEGLSLSECELMVANVKIVLASSPSWFRPFQMLNSLLLLVVSTATVIYGQRCYHGSEIAFKRTAQLLLVLAVLTSAAFLAAANVGPLLRAHYLWPLLFTLLVYISLLITGREIGSQLLRDQTE